MRGRRRARGILVVTAGFGLVRIGAARPGRGRPGNLILTILYQIMKHNFTCMIGPTGENMHRNTDGT